MSHRILPAPALLAAALALALPATPPALAQGQGTAFFTADLAAPAPVARFAAGGVVWRCEGTRCTGARSTARPLRVCSDLRREAGQVTRFASGAQALPEDQLARCNG